MGSAADSVLLILGLSAAIAPLRVALQRFRLDVPLLMGIAIRIWLPAPDGQLSRP